MAKARKSAKAKNPAMLLVAAAVCCSPGVSKAVSTYIDSTGDYAGGSATAPPAGDSYMDIASVVITNNSTNIFFQINLATSDGGHATNITTDTTQSYGKYQIGLETMPGAGNTAVSNPYNPIGISTGMNYWIDQWTNQTTGGTMANPDTGDGQVFAYSGGAWTQVAGNGLATDVAGNPQFLQTTLGTTSITTSVSLAALGLSVGNSFNFDAWSTYDGGVGAVDALDSGPNATSESSSTYINPYSSPVTPYDSATAPGSTYSTTIYHVSTPTFTWNNFPSTAGGDGITWDKAQYNFNNGIFADVYTDGSNVIFDDNHATSTSYAVTLNSAVTPASVVFNNSAATYTISGSGSIGGTGSLSVTASGTVSLATANTYSGGTNVSAGALIIQRTSATSSALPKGSVSITGGLLQLASNVTLGSQASPAASNVNITSLAISGNGTLDIGNNHIIIDYAAGHDPIGSIAAWIKGGFNAGAWNGAGIISSSAASNVAYGVGYADAADPGNPAGLSSGQIEIMYTLLGDANLDGKVNGADFAILATNFNKAVTGSSGWDQGDFNYDGKINGADFASLAGNFNKGASGAADVTAIDAFAQANGLSLTTSVPEPTTLGVMALAGAGLLRRRRSR
jgi:autotransporter-associated beta strand protein